LWEVASEITACQLLASYIGKATPSPRPNARASFSILVASAVEIEAARASAQKKGFDRFNDHWLTGSFKK
jgi:hypothetical protein